jgi:hypothetical protein
MAFFIGEALVVDTAALAVALVTSGGAGHRSGVCDHALGAAHSAWPTATHWPLPESPGSPHHAQPPREAH